MGDFKSCDTCRRNHPVYCGECHGFSNWASADSRKDYTNYSKATRPIIRIKKVIFNAPATIVYWDDGSKTVVKCSENDTFDWEKGLAMAIAKKALGDQGNYYNEFKKWMPEEEPVADPTPLEKALNNVIASINLAPFHKFMP